ncbi:MAG: hypothetical protein ACJAXK_001953 [Yoonia sp.]|jgi:hypothetical protein
MVFLGFGFIDFTSPMFEERNWGFIGAGCDELQKLADFYFT